MNILKNKNFYINTFLSFAVIVVIDWLLSSGFKLFQGFTFSQTLAEYKLPISFIGVAAVVAYSNLKKQQ